MRRAGDHELRLTEGVRPRKARARSRRPSPQQNRGRRRRWTGATAMHPEADGAGAHKIEILTRFCGFSRLCRTENFLIVTGVANGDRRHSPLRELEFETRDGREGDGTKAAFQAFLQAFPNLGCFAPSFSKDSFGRSVGFQRVTSLQAPNDDSPNFCGSAVSSRTPPAAKSVGIAEGT
jgi:hypothetical protein